MKDYNGVALSGSTELKLQSDGCIKYPITMSSQENEGGLLCGDKQSSKVHADKDDI